MSFFVGLTQPAISKKSLFFLGGAGKKSKEPSEEEIFSNTADMRHVYLSS